MCAKVTQTQWKSGGKFGDLNADRSKGMCVVNRQYFPLSQTYIREKPQKPAAAQFPTASLWCS